MAPVAPRLSDLCQDPVKAQLTPPSASQTEKKRLCLWDIREQKGIERVTPVLHTPLSGPCAMDVDA